VNSLIQSVDPKILKGVGAQRVILTYMTKLSKWKRGGWSKSLCSLIIAALPNEAGLPNE